MTWIKLTIQLPDEYQEVLITEMLDLDFEGFEQFDGKIEAFIPKSRFNDVNREYIEQLLAAYPGDNFIETEELEEENWNETWEQTIKPQVIGTFLVKPTWSPVKAAGGEILLEIDPKMSFGTGYHATTRLMLELLPGLSPAGKKVLDAGTGTGILAIAAAKLDARHVFGFDTDEWSLTNAQENVLLNHVDDTVDIASGSIETVPKEFKSDLILANINRNVILELLPEFTRHLPPDGKLALSGLLESDRSAVLRKTESLHLVLEKESAMDEWISLIFRFG